VTAMKLKNSIRIYALKICLSYAIVGGIWIFFSDRFLEWLASDVETLTAMQTYKGWFYVFMSALLVYLAATYYFRAFIGIQDKLKNSRQALSESRRTLYTLMENLPGMAYRCRSDRKYTMEFISPGVETLTGYKPEDLIDNKVLSYGDMIIPEDRNPVFAKIQEGIKAHKPFLLEYRITTRSGQVKWVWEQGRGVFDRDGRLEALEGYIFDITERKEMEVRMRESQRLQHIGQAASTIIHDMKNPMQVILGHLELLKRKGMPDYDTGHCGTIERQILGLMSMSRELLDYARGNMTLKFEEVNIAELLEHIIEIYGPVFNPRNINMSFTQRIESGASPLIAIDRDKIQRVLMNLVSNAGEAMPDGGKIQLRSWIDQESVRIEIQDNGPGIPEQVRENLFEPFVTYGKSNGTGLGLAIAQKIIANHRGDISFDTDENSGTTFTIVLPRSKTDKLEAEASSSAAFDFET